MCSLQDHYNNNPETIDRLLKLVVNSDSRNPRYKSASSRSLYKRLVADFPFTFSMIRHTDLQRWFTFSGTSEAPDFPKARRSFIASVERGHSRSLIHVTAASPAVRAMAHTARRKKRDAKESPGSTLLQAMNIMPMKS